MQLGVQQLESRLHPVVVFAKPADALVARGDFYDGIVKIMDSVGGIGTGGLIWRGVGQGFGHHIITAAHATPLNSPAFTTFELTRNGADVDIIIETPGGPGYQFRDPAWKCSEQPYDVGLIKIVDQDKMTQAPTRLMVAPFKAQQYEFQPGGLVVDQSIAKFAGYGRTGTGITGEMPGTAGVKRRGSNVLDQVDGPDFLYDFDNGTDDKNRMGNKGLGPDIEAVQVGGDSGSPIFIQVKIAGVLWPTSQVQGSARGRLGDVAFETRASVVLICTVVQ